MPNAFDAAEGWHGAQRKEKERNAPETGGLHWQLLVVADPLRWQNSLSASRVCACVRWAVYHEGSLPPTGALDAGAILPAARACATVVITSIPIPTDLMLASR